MDEKYETERQTNKCKNEKNIVRKGGINKGWESKAMSGSEVPERWSAKPY